MIMQAMAGIGAILGSGRQTGKMDLAGRVAMVTGGAHRVGGAISLALAEAGMDVAIAYRSAATEARGLADGLSGMGVRAIPIAVDVAEPRAAHRQLP
jgi:3-oxoacyl-[acyl-carrier protein] reductase